MDGEAGWWTTSGNIGLPPLARAMGVGRQQQQFAFNSSSDNYSHMFNRYRLKLEKKTIDFDTNDQYSYNDVFTLHELKQAIKISRDTSPGIDTVHYQLLKHLPEDSLLLLLYIFNHIWLTQDFPTSWKTAIIIPVPKSGKVLSDPGSYRPIALTSCLCKTMERMVNSRLTWYLERHMVITEYQSGFRRRRSTVDNLVTLSTTKTSFRSTTLPKWHTNSNHW